MLILTTQINFPVCQEKSHCGLGSVSVAPWNQTTLIILSGS